MAMTLVCPIAWHQIGSTLLVPTGCLAMDDMESDSRISNVGTFNGKQS
jgi:hypothetical protein